MTEKNKEIIKRIYDSMFNGIRLSKSVEAKKWLDKKGLSIELTHACFNSGQLHHRKPDDFIQELKSVGFLIESDKGTNTGKKGYSSFGREAIVFPLKNNNGVIVNFCAIRIQLEAEKTIYMNKQGIYPAYPSSLTKKLYITNTIIDAATLLESKMLDNKEAVMALHDGELSDEHLQAINGLKELTEIILIK
jgi:hypothetical protein